MDLEYEIEHSKELSVREKKAIDEGIENAESGQLYSNAQLANLLKNGIKKNPAPLFKERDY